MLPWYVFGLIAAVLAAFASIIGKQTLFKEHAMEFSATLAIVNAIITAPLLLMIDYSGIPGHAYALMMVIALLGASAYLLVSKAVRHSPLSMTSPLFALGPVITALVAFGLLGEKLSITNIAGLVLVVVGAYVLEHHKGVSIAKNLKLIYRERHVRLMLAALLLYGFCGVIDRYLLGPNAIGSLAMAPTEYIPITQVLIAVVFLVMILLFHDGCKGIAHGFKTAWKPIVAIAICTLGYRFASTYGIVQEAGKVALISGLKRTSAFFAALIGGHLLHEAHLLERSFATLIMIGGVLLIII